MDQTTITEIEEDATPEWSVESVDNTQAVTRRFYALRHHGENPLESNLTELLAAESVDRGFFGHNDWAAHVMRYQHVLNHLKPTYYAGTGRDRRGVYDVSMLDVGCGAMQLPYYAHRNRQPPIREYWGVDLRAKGDWLRDMQWKTPMHLVRADFSLDADAIARCAGWPGQFDFVVYMEAHEHVGGGREQQVKAMENVASWVKPGGLLFFSTPNAGVSDSTAANHLAPDGTSREWTYRDKLALLADVGLEVQAAYGTFGGVRRLPEEAMASKEMRAAREYLSTSLFTVFAFAAYPEYANNAIIRAIKVL